MRGYTQSDFAALLDDLVAESARKSPDDASGSPARPSMPYGFVASPSMVEEFWSSVSDDLVASIYTETGRESDTGAPSAAAGVLSPIADPIAEQIFDLPPIDPARIADELGIEGVTDRRGIDRVRRDFAFANHPDRVAPHLRDRAMIRMQIANMLIDQAKRKVAALS